MSPTIVPDRARRIASLCALAAGLALVLALAACGGAPPPPRAIRLVDLYEPDLVQGTAGGETTPPERTEWRFDGPPPSPPPEKHAATRGWAAGPGIADLALREGRLAGRTTKDLSLLHLERTPDPAARDTLHAVEVRLRVSAGANLQVEFSGDEKADLDKAAGYFRDFRASITTTPIIAGDEIRSYSVRPLTTVVANDVRHVFLRPTDVAGARFEIESIRLVFRHEYLEEIASGRGWQGLSEIYSETLVARSPETIRFRVTLPPRPWLDLSIGTVEDGPVTFRVGVARGGASRGSDGEASLLERTVTRPHRWERAPVDLSAFAGESVTVSLSLAAGRKGMLGFWGSPVIRDLGAPADARAQGAPPQGVILIWADTLRRDHLSLYGYGRETSPVLDAMAREGVLFRDSVSQATWTKVATPALLTSLYPSSHGVRDFADRLPAGATTLAEVFREAGYATLSMSSILFTGQFTNLHQGFEEVHESGSLPERRSSKTAREYVDRLLPWLEAHRETPFFVLLHVSDPHDPYKPYAPYDTMWADGARAREHEKHAESVRTFIADPLLKAFGMPTREELAKAGLDPEAYVAFDRDWYDGSIRAMDAEIGRLVERLRGLGLAERTLVVFAADHGEEFLEHGRMFHGQSVYGELSRMPLILWAPGSLPRGIEIERTVETIDVMPTILDLAGLAPPPRLQGSSLVPLIADSGPAAATGAVAAARESAGDGEDARPAITEKATTSEGGGGPPPHDTESFAIALDGFKLVHNTRRPEGRPEYELYDAARDPLDLDDLASSRPEVVERLARELAAWRRDAEAARLPPDSETAKDLTPEELERLRGLGYIK